MSSGMHEDSIERLYKRFQEAWIDGRAPDPEEYCRRHLKGEEAMRLQARIEEFLFTDGCLRIDDESRGRRPKKRCGDEENAAGAALGDFRLLREIGRGGMGVVYEARQESLNRTVALKVLPAHLTLREESVARFQREASTAARLKHPGIVKIHAVGEEEGAHYFAMEFVEGAPLNKVIDRIRGEGIHSLDGGRLYSAVSSERHVPSKGPGPEKETMEREGAGEDLWKKTYIEAACRLVIRVAEALDFAHNSGVIHRDVKPSNILVRKDATAVLTDFGLAREEGLPSLSITGEFAGTPHYISPEQTLAGRKKVDHRSDIYSLGVTLFELLTLSKPFDGKTSQEVLGKILSHEPPLPRGRNPLVPRDLETICMTAMEKDPDRRYPSAKEFGEDLKRFLEFKPIQARPVGMVTRTYRVIRRNPAYSMVIGLLFLLVVAGPLVFGVQQKLANIRIRDALEDKEKALKRADEEAARARREEETAKQVSDYLVEIFKVPMPSEARGRTVTAFEVLQRGVESIEERLADRPAIRTRILETLGVAHKSLGLYSEAEPLLRQALETNVETLGEDHVTTLKSAHNLGMIHLCLGRYDTAESFLEKACEGICRRCGEEDAEALAVKNDLGMLYLEQNRFEEAERIYEQILEARRRLFGEDHPRTFESMNNLALVYNKQGRFREAEALYLKTIERSAPRLGDDNPDVLTVRSNLSLLYESQGRYDEAERLFLEVLEMRRRVLGDDHPDTFNTWNDLALIYKRTGRFREAERFYLLALEKRRLKLDDDHPDTLITKNNLAALYVEEGSFQEAENLFREVLEVRRRVLGEDHADTLTTLCNLAVLYSMQNRYDDAEPLYDEVLRVRRRIFGDDHPDTLNTMNSVATLYSKQGRFHEAEAMYLRVLEMYHRKYGDSGSLLAVVLCNFAHHYASNGRFDEAEPLAREAVEVTNPRSMRFAVRKELHDAILEEVNRRRNTGRPSSGEEDR